MERVAWTSNYGHVRYTLEHVVYLAGVGIVVNLELDTGVKQILSDLVRDPIRAFSSCASAARCEAGVRLIPTVLKAMLTSFVAVPHDQHI